MEVKYEYVKNYYNFLQNIKKISDLPEEDLDEFLRNKIISLYFYIYFLNEENKNNYPQLYEIYKSIENDKK